MRFVAGPPTFAVEVRSENDYGPSAEREMAAKRADYFEAGTRVVWDVDPDRRDCRRISRRAPDQPGTSARPGGRRRAGRAGLADRGGPDLPGVGGPGLKRRPITHQGRRNRG